MYHIKELFNLEKTLAGDYLSGFSYPWEALGGLKDFIRTLGNSLNKGEYDEIANEIWAHKSAKIAPTACLSAPCVICAGAEIRHSAFLRGSVLVGKDCVVGNSTELKNVILFDSVQVPHYNYVGDSVLGFKSHMGAGSITSNVKSDKTLVVVRFDGEELETGMKKVGAMLGDFVEIGCNSVLNPGTVIGRNASVYPLSCVRGTVAENSIYKNKNEIVFKK